MPEGQSGQSDPPDDDPWGDLLDDDGDQPAAPASPKPAVGPPPHLGGTKTNLGSAPTVPKKPAPWRPSTSPANPTLRVSPAVPDLDVRDDDDDDDAALDHLLASAGATQDAKDEAEAEAAAEAAPTVPRLDVPPIAVGDLSRVSDAEPKGRASKPAKPTAAYPIPSSPAVESEQAEVAPPPKPTPPPPKQLPRPSMLRDGTGAFVPLAEFRDLLEDGPKPNPAAAPPPPGVVPPSAEVDGVAPTNSDTQSLINAVAGELIAEHERAAMVEASADSLPIPPPQALVEGSGPTVEPGVLDTGAFRPAPISRSRGLIVAAALILAFLLVWAWASGGDDEPPDEPTKVARAEAPAAPGGDGAAPPAAPPADGAVVAEKPAEPPAPDPDPVPVPAVVDEAAGEGEADTGEEEIAIEVSDETEDAAPQPPTPPTPAGSTADPPTKASSGRRPSKSRKRKKTPTRPKPPPKKKTKKKKPAKKATPKTATALLAEAKRAYGSGRASKAYSLAKQSNAKAPSHAAIELMGKAACKMGNKSRAQAAMRRLPFGKRGGIRRVCKSKGIRTGP